jgi:hypothetical protein
MAKARRGSGRRGRPTSRSDGSSATNGESGGFIGQLGLAETGGTSPGLIGIAVAFLLAIAVYPIGWLIRRARRRD